MIYALEQTQILQRVFDRAVTFPAHRLAGYCANIGFWAAEIHHCLDLLSGYQHRFRAMKQATQEYLRLHPIQPPDIPPELGRFHMPAWELDPRTSRGVTDTQIEEARHSLEKSARRFLTRCFEAGVFTEQQLLEINETVGCELVDKLN